MRAFKNASKKTIRMLENVFPIVFEDPDWQDSEEVSSCAISVWSYWLHTKDESQLLNNVTAHEQNRRDDMFRSLHKNIINNLQIFNCRFTFKKNRFKEVRCREDLYWRLDPNYSKSSHFLFLPEIRAIYSYAGDDTSVMYYWDPELLKTFDQWVEASGLKYVQRPA